jgi:predicted RNA binding protein YcfA (HicA-like mRNA interferase family)
LGRLKVFSGAELCRLLGAHGFQVVRQKGSHVIMQKTVPGSTITVPVPNHREIRVGTLKSIVRQSKLATALFEQV